MVCINKLEDIEAFSKKVITNQKMLYQLLNDGREKLESFYSLLNPKLSVKVEIIDESLSLDNKENEIKNMSFEHVCENTRNEENEEPVKSEQTYNQSFQYSSEDEVTLSSLKQKTETKSLSKRKAKCGKKCAKEKLSKPQKEIQIKSEMNNPITIIKNKNHKCLTCSDLFTSQNELLKHYRKEHSSKKDKDIMNSYTISEGKDILSYKCTKCDRVYDNLRAVKRHLEAHVKDRPFICKECGKYI